MNAASNFSAEEWAPALVFCLCCYAIVRVTRNVVEGTWPHVLQRKWWDPLALNLLPILLGLVGALPVLRYNLPSFASTTFSRLTLGMLLGFFSSMAYKGFRVYVKRRTGISLDKEEGGA